MGPTGMLLNFKSNHSRIFNFVNSIILSQDAFWIVYMHVVSYCNVLCYQPSATAPDVFCLNTKNAVIQCSMYMYSV